MKAINKALVVGMTAATLFTGSTSPALAAQTIQIDNAGAQAATARRSFLQLQEDVSYTCGIWLRVKYTYNDAYGTISGINSITMTRCPSGISNVSWTYTKMNGGDYYLIIVHYAQNGQRLSETGKLWA
ncbi:hypothetical protein [uncultured Parolsenella sp.]|uniref:hypothetical protein n=1 Tax=uncultured Parolsenella sp. TaxID=2083008 RepID=UPI0025CE5D6C|nr:hypothetical protein [uncultured Parolsenella sp.]